MTPHILKFFKYDHLPQKLQEVSKACSELATRMVQQLPENSNELYVGLRKLLEAKDCFVRALLEKEATDGKLNV